MSFYAKTGEQSLLTFLVLLRSQNQIQKIVLKQVKSICESFYLTKMEISMIQSGYQVS